MNVGFWVSIYYLIGIILLLDLIEQDHSSDETLTHYTEVRKTYKWYEEFATLVYVLTVLPLVYYTLTDD
jgi:hypothetical protein